MKIFKTKATQLLAIAISTFLFVTSVTALDVAKPLKDYLQECPWLGLIANQITFGPITVSNVHIHDKDKLAIVAPGEKLNGSLKYKVDAKDLESLHRYHLVIGIKGEGAQDCVTHNLGIWNSKGTGNFTLKAPEKQGIYEVRFLLSEGLTCCGARDVWNSGQDKPSSAATIGVIIVE
jgi:hypothetical protein